MREFFFAVMCIAAGGSLVVQFLLHNIHIYILRKRIEVLEQLIEAKRRNP